jgi:CHAT domain-containing protein
MSSYSSSIKAIIRSRQSPVPSFNSAQALLVAVEHTPGYARLPFATDEISVLHDFFKLMHICPIEPRPCKDDVIFHLTECNIFHFAGHGLTDSANPSNSGLLLEDGASDPLTVATLLHMNLRQHPAFLAYLSACGTGRIKEGRCSLD